MKITISFLFICLYCSSFLCANSSKVSAQTKGDSTVYYGQLAMNPKEDTDLVSAYNYFIKHKQFCLDNNYKEGAIHDLNMLTIIQKESGFYYDSEASAIEAISLLDQLEVSDFSIRSKVSLYNELGKINRALKEYERALRFYNKALEFANKPEEQNRIINNRAFIYIDKKDYELAQIELQKAYDISIKIQDEIEIARNLDNLGFVESKRNNPTALQKLEMALKKRQDLNTIEGLYASYKHLFIYHKDRNNQEKAQLYLDKALEIANQLNSDSYKLDALSEYMELKEDSLVRTYKNLTDKTQLDRLLAENKFASKKYDYTKKELEAQKSKSAKERSQAIILLLLVFGVFTFILVRSKHKKDKIEQVFKTESRISKKIHDELANDVSDIMNYVETDLQSSPENKLKLLNTLEDVYVRTRDISTQMASLNFSDFSESLKNLLIQHNKPDVKVIIGNIDAIDWRVIPNHKKWAVYRALQELMVNMKKHSQANIVSIAFKSNKNKHEIWYKDDGVGALFKEITKSGITNAEYRIKEIGGSFNFETSKGNGFKAIIIFYS